MLLNGPVILLFTGLESIFDFFKDGFSIMSSYDMAVEFWSNRDGVWLSLTVLGDLFKSSPIEFPNVY